MKRKNNPKPVHHDFYVVQAIRNKRISITGIIEYKIKWMGWAQKDNTWEPISNLYGISLMIDEFERIERERVGGEMEVEIERGEGRVEQQGGGGIERREDENSFEYGVRYLIERFGQEIEERKKKGVIDVGVEKEVEKEIENKKDDVQVVVNENNIVQKVEVQVEVEVEIQAQVEVEVQVNQINQINQLINQLIDVDQSSQNYKSFPSPFVESGIVNQSNQMQVEQYSQNNQEEESQLLQQEQICISNQCLSENSASSSDSEEFIVTSNFLRKRIKKIKQISITGKLRKKKRLQQLHLNEFKQQLKQQSLQQIKQQFQTTKKQNPYQFGSQIFKSLEGQHLQKRFQERREQKRLLRIKQQLQGRQQYLEEIKRKPKIRKIQKLDKIVERVKMVEGQIKYLVKDLNNMDVCVMMNMKELVRENRYVLLEFYKKLIIKAAKEKDRKGLEWLKGKDGVEEEEDVDMEEKSIVVGYKEIANLDLDMEGVEELDEIQKVQEIQILKEIERVHEKDEHKSYESEMNKQAE